MGIKIFYILSIIYGIVSGLGFFKKELPLHFLYIFLVIIAFYYLYYTYKKKIDFFHTIIACIIVNLSVQLTGGIRSPLFFIYPVILLIIGYKEKYRNYWIVVLSLFSVEILSSVFNHNILILHLVIFAAAIVIFGVIIEKYTENEVFLKKSLIKYESRDKFFSPADFEIKAIITSVSDIDKHPGIERPLLFYIKLIHNMFGGYTTAIFSCYNNCLTLIQGFSHSELFNPDTIIDLKSGIYRQIISSGRPILIKEFVQNPEELGYYKGEIKIASVMVAPIILINKVEAVLITDKKVGQFSEADKEKFAEAAKSAGFLIAMLRLYEQKSDEAKYLRFIADHVEELHKELELKKILSDAAQSFRTVMECNDVSIAAVDELNNIGEILESTNIKEHRKFSLDDGLVGAIARYKKFIIKEDLGKGNFVVFKKGVKTKNLSFVGVPIQQDDELLGVMWLEDHQTKKFNEDSARVLNILASQLSFAWQRANLHDRVKELSKRDGLTGLYNHVHFHKILEEEIGKGKELVLLFFDIDHFKKINDTYGHQAGDKVLEFLGKLIQKTGIAARYGGEEFAIILPKCSLKKGIDQAVRLKDHLLKSEIRFNKVKIMVTVSIGVAHYPADAKTRVELIERADRAVYRAKDLGRDRIVIAQTMERLGNQRIRRAGDQDIRESGDQDIR